ncbi:MAG: LysR family transcriptional regulator [Burkholderiales bacterium]|nr:LysR family transcriptional regulator [Burkholderiales bacterium]
MTLRHRRIDLNLLAALDVLLAERNVTRAAQVMNVTQSAMSGTLARLREVFDDALPVPVGRRMQRTPLAESLCEPTRDALRRIDALLTTRPVFDPASADRHFVISASDYVISAVLTDALRVLAREAPRIRFDLVSTEAAAGLASGEVDLCVVPANMVLEAHPQAKLFDDSYSVLAWADNPRIGKALTLDTYLALGHVVFRGGKGPLLPWFEQWFRNEHGEQRNLQVHTHSFGVLPQLVIGTERIATVPTRLAERAAQTLPLRLCRLPMKAPRLTEVLQWNRMHDGDPAIRWLRERLLALAAG